MRITKNVFIDTSVIVNENFHYTGNQLRGLEQLASSGEATLLTTSIVTGEVESRIREFLKQAAPLLKVIKTDGRILRNLSKGRFDACFRTLDIEEEARQLIHEYLEYLKRTKTTVLSLEYATAESVFDQYFSVKLPFEEKKKHEFPDAFNVSVLEQWCRKHQQHLYVITSDKGVAEYCKTSKFLFHQERPSEYIGLFFREKPVLEALQKSVEEHMDEIERAISSKFAESGFYLTDQEGDIEDIEVDHIAIHELSLIEDVKADVQPHVAKFAVFADIKFRAQVSYADMDTAMWDHEEKVAIPLHTINAEIERSVGTVVTVKVELTGGNKYSAVKEAKFPEMDFGVEAVEDEWPYK